MKLISTYRKRIVALRAKHIERKRIRKDLKKLKDLKQTANQITRLYNEIKKTAAL